MCEAKCQKPDKRLKIRTLFLGPGSGLETGLSRPNGHPDNALFMTNAVSRLFLGVRYWRVLRHRPQCVFTVPGHVDAVTQTVTCLCLGCVKHSERPYSGDIFAALSTSVERKKKSKTFTQILPLLWPFQVLATDTCSNPRPGPNHYHKQIIISK